MKTCLILNAKRKALGFTQEQLGAICGVRGSTISRIINEDPNISLETIKKVMDNLNGYLRSLDREEYLKVQIATSLELMDYTSQEEKIESIGYMQINLGKLLLEVSGMNER